MDPWSLALQGRFFTTGPTREVPMVDFLKDLFDTWRCNEHYCSHFTDRKTEFTGESQDLTSGRGAVTSFSQGGSSGF